MSLEFLELSKKVQEVNNLLSVVAYDSQSGKGAVLYDSQTTLEFILWKDKTITMLGGDTVKYGSWDDLELDSPLLIKVFNLFEKAIHEIFKNERSWKYNSINEAIADISNMFGDWIDFKLLV